MFGWQNGFSICLLGFAVACGGRVREEASAGSAGTSTIAGATSASGGRFAGFGGSPFGAGGASRGGASGSGGAFVDPGCPDIPPPPPVVECDPLDSSAGCAAGDGCYPYVDHPFGDSCGTEVSGTICRSAGSGVQGELCGEGTAGCAPGHVCVLGQLSGKRCAKLCLRDEPNSCGNGLICDGLDVPGWGSCG